jgi:hypothetical protein
MARYPYQLQEPFRVTQYAEDGIFTTLRIAVPRYLTGEHVLDFTEFSDHMGWRGWQRIEDIPSSAYVTVSLLQGADNAKLTISSGGSYYIRYFINLEVGPSVKHMNQFRLELDQGSHLESVKDFGTLGGIRRRTNLIIPGRHSYIQPDVYDTGKLSINNLSFHSVIVTQREVSGINKTLS